MDELIKPKMADEKRKMLQHVREEATENAISLVKAKMKEQLDAQKEETATSEAEDKHQEKEGEGESPIKLRVHLVSSFSA